jgi:hypothetical protein
VGVLGEVCVAVVGPRCNVSLAGQTAVQRPSRLRFSSPRTRLSDRLDWAMHTPARRLTLHDHTGHTPRLGVPRVTSHGPS